MDAGKAATIAQNLSSAVCCPSQGSQRRCQGWVIPSSSSSTLPGAHRDPEGTGNAACVQQGLPAAPLMPGGIPTSSAVLCWQPPVSLAVQTASSKSCPCSHGTAAQGCPEPCPSAVQVPGARTPAAQVSQGLCCLPGQCCSWASRLCHAVKHVQGISPALGFSPPSALRDKHTAAASTSSSIWGFAE